MHNWNFNYPPSPAVLQGLSGGQLASRWQRVVRLWWLLRSLYGSESPWRSLPDPFRYGDLRSRLFAPSHGQADQTTVSALTKACRGGDCVCQKSLQALIAARAPELDWEDWRAGMVQSTGLPPEQIALTGRPFAAVHRSIRDDLKALVTQGWLRQTGRGLFQRVPSADWPVLAGMGAEEAAGLSTAETWELLSALQAIAFVQPNLEVVINRLWEQATATSEQHRHGWQAEPTQRIFVHLDYILPTPVQERIDTHQEVIEQLWRSPDGGVIQFENHLARQNRTATVTVYPVCLHYARRAKYLSAYGLDPDGAIGWHNYRLDRIGSERLRVLPWGDPAIPTELKQMRACGELPTPADVEAALAEAWGFNFYLPKAWLLMRFPAAFARWYVDDTERHPTFQPVAYGDLPGLMAAHAPEGRQRLRGVIEGRSSTDVYYQGWVRLGDINVVMRLRDWRPNGEVIAPWGLRRQMGQEAIQEVGHYR